MIKIRSIILVEILRNFNTGCQVSSVVKISPSKEKSLTLKSNYFQIYFFLSNNLIAYFNLLLK